MTVTTLPRRAKRPRAGGHERWLVSYADLVTLLFAVFAMLYAISTVDTEKLARLVSTMQVVFHSGGVGIGVPLGSVTDITPRRSSRVSTRCWSGCGGPSRGGSRGRSARSVSR